MAYKQSYRMTEGFHGHLDGVAAQQHHAGSRNKPDHQLPGLALLRPSLQLLKLHGFPQSLTNDGCGYPRERYRHVPMPFYSGLGHKISDFKARML